MKTHPNLAHLVDAVKQLRCSCRVQVASWPEPSEWDWPLFSPVDGCLETGSLGPVAVGDVEWVEVDPIVETPVGVRVSPRREDLSTALEGIFRDTDLPFTKVEGRYRIYFLPTNP